MKPAEERKPEVPLERTATPLREMNPSQEPPAAPAPRAETPSMQEAKVAEILRQVEAQHGPNPDIHLTEEALKAMGIPVSPELKALGQVFEKWRKKIFPDENSKGG